jgi:hypothetical protein
VSLHLLPAFTPEALRQEFGQLSQTLFLIDCVLGLPREVEGFKNLWSEFKRAHLCRKERGFGRSSADHFFTELLLNRTGSKKGSFPKRQCEELAKANSVFQKHPFQKNIQTGTFRFWAELGESGKPWARLWPQDFKGEKSPRGSERKVLTALPIVAEGYPSLLWREVFGFSTRSSKQLVERIQTDPEFKKDLVIESAWLKKIATHSDFADAFVLAYGGMKLHREGLLFSKSVSENRIRQALHQEGWIAGLRNEIRERET